MVLALALVVGWEWGRILKVVVVWKVRVGLVWWLGWPIWPERRDALEAWLAKDSVGWRTRAREIYDATNLKR